MIFFSTSDFSEGQEHLRSAGEVEPSAPKPTADSGPPECTENSRCSVEGRGAQALQYQLEVSKPAG